MAEDYSNKDYFVSIQLISLASRGRLLIRSPQFLIIWRSFHSINFSSEQRASSIILPISPIRIVSIQLISLASRELNYTTIYVSELVSFHSINFSSEQRVRFLVTSLQTILCFHSINFSSEQRVTMELTEKIKKDCFHSINFSSEQRVK